MKMDNNRVEQVVHLAREQGMLDSSDLKKHNIPREYLQRLYKRGRLLRSGRGIYVLADMDFTENYSYAEACKRVPRGVVCLLSALRYHNLGTQSPFQVWMAVPASAHRPHVDYPPLRIVRFSGFALCEGIEEHTATEGQFRVYNVPKTVADCFRYRNKIGLDVAQEALYWCWREKRATLNELWHYAQALKITSVMQPYMDDLA